MLVNLTKDAKKAKKLQQMHKAILRNTEGHSDQLWAAEQKRYWEKHPFNYDAVLKPYSPCGDEYAPDTTNDFTGVYLFYGYREEDVINYLTKNHCLKSLVDYGNVDNASQAIKHFKENLEAMKEFGLDTSGNYVILMHPMRRNRVYTWEEAMGTYRWHKNGGYSGKANVCSEYFLSEPDEKLKLVYSFTVCKVV
jgi:hypothetical protein